MRKVRLQLRGLVLGHMLVNAPGSEGETVTACVGYVTLAPLARVWMSLELHTQSPES